MTIIMEMENINVYKFSDTASDEPPTLKGENIQEFIKNKYLSRYSFGNNEIQKFGRFKLMGWCFDLKPYLKKYIVNQYDSWFEYYAPNKTLLRKSLYGRINNIVEVKK